MKNVPKLRFKGFSDEWEEKKLYSLGEFFKGNGISKSDLSEDGHECILYGELYTKYNEVIDKVYSKTNIELNNKVLSKVNDVIIPSSGETAIDIATASCVKRDDVLLGGDLNVFRPKNTNGVFISYQLNNSKRNEIAKVAQGASVVHVYNEQLKKIKLNLPSIEEQEKIANFLTKVDKLIEKQDEKVNNLEQYKKGMMQKIFSQEIRFKKDDGGEFTEWEKKHLEHLVERVVRKNKGNVSKRPLTISAQYGLVDQEEFFNKVVASSNLEGYYLLNNGEFAYNKSYSNGYPFGAIKRLDRYDNGAVSTLYICFKSKNRVSSDFLVKYFESSMWHKEVSMIAVEGARNHGLLNISVSDFFETIHKFPCLDEQNKIANFLSKIDLIVEKEKEKLEELREWKKGLLQGMFV